MNFLSLEGLSRYTDKLKAYIDSKLTAPSVSSAPVGTISWYTNTDPPPGYLICDGSLISRNLYSDLFAVIGTTFGSGDGSTTFALPDLRAAFIRGTGSANGYNGQAIGEKQEPTYIGVGSGTLYNYSESTLSWNAKNATEIKYKNADKTGQIEYTNENKVDVSTIGMYHKQRAKSVAARPYNISLTPIIKY